MKYGTFKYGIGYLYGIVKGAVVAIRISFAKALNYVFSTEKPISMKISIERVMDFQVDAERK